MQKRNGTKTDLNAARNVINKNNYVLLTAAAADAWASPASSESSNSFLKLWRWLCGLLPRPGFLNESREIVVREGPCMLATYVLNSIPRSGLFLIFPLYYCY